MKYGSTKFLKDANQYYFDVAPNLMPARKKMESLNELYYQSVTAIWFLALLIFFTNLNISSAATIKTAEAEQKANLEVAKESQKKVDKTFEETQSLKTKYRQVLQSIENTRIYNDQLKEVIASQKDEKAKIAEEIISVQETTKKVAPLMVKMKDSLAEFVAADLPFLPKERQKRVKDLEALFVKSGVSLSEKYRKVLEAYLVENEYGATIETYMDTIDLKDQEQSVEFLKVGRVGLYYITKDRKKAGVWDLNKNAWLPLSGSERSYIEKAVKVANKQSSPSLLTLPIIRSEVGNLRSSRLKSANLQPAKLKPAESKLDKSDQDEVSL